MRAAEPVKIERHDVAGGRHHTNTGVRPVHTYREHAHGLFVARDFVAHPRIRAWQAHLLPEIGVQVCRYDFHGPREHDHYIDIATVTREGDLWTVRDHYLDVIVHDGMAAEIVDTDELVAAHEAGFICAAELCRAVSTAHRVASGLVRARYSVPEWLAGQGVHVEWLSAPQTVTV